MNRWNSKFMFTLLCAAVMIVLAACGNDNDAGNDSMAPSEAEAPGVEEFVMEPVTLTFYNMTPAALNQQAYKDLVEAQIRNKYPQITLEYIESAAGNRLNDLLAGGIVPDIMYSGMNGLYSYREMGLVTDLTPLVRKYNVDLNRFHKGLIEEMAMYVGAPGTVPALPFTFNAHVMTYNKDLFDRFGVPYPEDGMTYDDAVDLARRMSRTEDGVQYKGMHLQNGTILSYNKLSLSMVEPGTDRVLFNVAPHSDGWKMMFETLKQFFDIPGNYPISDYNQHFNRFSQERRLAMMVTANPVAYLTPDIGFEWDLATAPTLPSQPNVGLGMFFEHMMVNGGSRHHEEAFLAVLHLMSDEVQAMVSRSGSLTVLTNEQIQNEFGQDMDNWRGKNVGAFFALDRAPSIHASRYDERLKGVVTAEFRNWIEQKIPDVNSLLRVMDERSVQIIEEMKK